MSTSSRGWRKSEEQFNPLRIAQPLPLSAQQRGAIEVVMGDPYPIRNLR